MGADEGHIDSAGFVANPALCAADIGHERVAREVGRNLRQERRDRLNRRANHNKITAQAGLWGLVENGIAPIHLGGPLSRFLTPRPGMDAATEATLFHSERQ